MTTTQEVLNKDWSNQQLCELLPDGVMWGENLTPELVREILSRAAIQASAEAQPSAPVAQAERHVLTDAEISDLISIAQFLQTVEHWEAKAGSKRLAEITKKLLSTAPQVEAKEGGAA